MCVTILIAIVNGSAIGVQWRKIFVISKAVCALHANQQPTALAREKNHPGMAVLMLNFIDKKIIL